MPKNFGICRIQIYISEAYTCICFRFRPAISLTLNPAFFNTQL
ncbi:Uncharacterized protein dnm_077700 [Desulfonema magnum]|uniref:Uncharacterized protein n=1 Tax=Desulfonema magnum TaxID=45655 RepID=A0A975BUF3_9BACT|nr:Uncharacterized protein dnm_077700 [Desulfonema magnum]